MDKPTLEPQRLAWPRPSPPGLLALLLGVTAFAGCLAVEGCHDDQCEPKDTPLVERGSAVETERLEFFGCYGGFGRLTVPVDWVEEFYPDYVEPRGSFVGGTATHVWNFLACDDAVLRNETLGPVSFVTWSLWTRSQDFDNHSVLSYAHSGWSDSPTINAWWRVQGVATYDAVIQRTLALAPTGTGVESWSLEAENESITWSVDRPGALGRSTEALFWRWFGPDQGVMEIEYSASLETVIGSENMEMSLARGGAIDGALGPEDRWVASAITLVDTDHSFLMPKMDAANANQTNTPSSD